MGVITWIIGSVLIVSLMSFIGVLTLSIKEKLLNRILLALVSLSAGTLFGDVLLHLLPEAVEKSGFTLLLSLLVLAGVVTFFVIEKIIHIHTTCQEPTMTVEQVKATARHHQHLTYGQHKHHLGFMNLLGDAIHNFGDGLIIAASYFISIPVGVATTLAVVLHEVPQELADFGVLIYSGFTKRKAVWLNFASAMVAVIGALVGILLGRSSEMFLKVIIPLAAGGFLYIAGSNLIPELHKECDWKSSFWHILALLLGIGLMVALLFLE